MAGAAIKIEIDDRAVQDAFRRLARAGEDPDPALRAIGEYLLTAIERRFESQSGPGGKPWQKLSPRTLKRKKGGKILTESHNLRNRFAYRVAGDTLEVGTNVVYAAIHQFGGTIEHAAYSVKQRLRTDGKGNLLKQKTNPNLLVYAKTRHKRAITIVSEIGAHKTTIPPRPFLGVDDADREEITAIIMDSIEGAWRGGQG